MPFLQKLRLWLRPPRMIDPDFGSLAFMHIAKMPERSYWECEWKFPRTGTTVFIALQGGEAGPSPEARRFYLELPDRFEEILAACRPRLEEVFRKWLDASLPADIFSVVKLSGFGVDNPNGNPLHWDISFETTGDKWLGITVPFADETALEAEVDT